LDRKRTAGRSIRAILLLCVMAAAAGGAAVLQGSERKQAVSESSGSFDLTARTVEDLQGISWTEDGTTRTYTLKDGSWEAADAAAREVDQREMRGLAESLVNLQATRKIENVSDTEDYGLKDPAVTVTAQWRSGSTVFCMGDATPFGDGYYLTVSGQDDTVYTIAAPLEMSAGSAR